MQNAVHQQTDAKLVKETVTVPMNAQEILYVEKIIVYLYLDIALLTLIAVKRVRHCKCGISPMWKDKYHLIHFFLILEVAKTRLRTNPKLLV